MLKDPFSVNPPLKCCTVKSYSAIYHAVFLIYFYFLRFNNLNLCIVMYFIYFYIQFGNFIWQFHSVFALGFVVTLSYHSTIKINQISTEPPFVFFTLYEHLHMTTTEKKPLPESAVGENCRLLEGWWRLRLHDTIQNCRCVMVASDCSCNHLWLEHVFRGVCRWRLELRSDGGWGEVLAGNGRTLISSQSRVAQRLKVLCLLVSVRSVGGCWVRWWRAGASESGRRRL